MVREETALVLRDDGLDDEQGGRRGSAVCVWGSGFLEVALLADEGPDEGVVVLEEGDGEDGSSGFRDELGGEVAGCAC